MSRPKIDAAAFCEAMNDLVQDETIPATHDGQPVEIFEVEYHRRDRIDVYFYPGDVNSFENDDDLDCQITATFDQLWEMLSDATTAEIADLI